MSDQPIERLPRLASLPIPASGSAEGCRLSDYARGMPLKRPTADFGDRLLTHLQEVAQLGATWRTDSFQLDVAAFSGPPRALLDDGDLPPEWCYLCLSLAESILGLPTPDGTQALIHIPAKRLTIPLTIADLCAELGGNAWRADGALFILWGARLDLLKKRSGPIACGGVLFPILDGLGLGWATDDASARRIGLPIDD